MHSVNEIIQYYFCNQVRFQDSNEKDNKLEDSVYDYNQCHQDYLSESEDSTDTENEDSYKFVLGM